ncbi:MAG: tryptophan--tRNA ligase [Myxococcota bacterium]
MAGRVALTGVKPTGAPHLGNWLGAIRPGLALAAEPDVSAAYFIADGHAVISLHDPAILRQFSLEVAATWLAFGLDPERTLVYRQSDLPEVYELSWLLGCMTPKGFMNKAHAYKAARDANVAAGRDPDADVNIGLYTYPVLMAADILIVDADLVPVGSDQVQHVEITRDVAQRINAQFGEGTLKLPQARVQAATAVIPGLDGRKMSKSYNNSIPCFASAKQLRKAVMRIQTDTSPPEAPKDPDGSLVFDLHSRLLDADAKAALAERYRAGVSWGEAKQALADALEAELAGPRDRYEALLARPDTIEDLLRAGIARARPIAQRVVDRVRVAYGMQSRWW